MPVPGPHWGRECRKACLAASSAAFMIGVPPRDATQWWGEARADNSSLSSARGSRLLDDTCWLTKSLVTAGRLAHAGADERPGTSGVLYERTDATKAHVTDIFLMEAQRLKRRMGNTSSASHPERRCQLGQISESEETPKPNEALQKKSARAPDRKTVGRSQILGGRGTAHSLTHTLTHTARRGCVRIVYRAQRLQTHTHKTTTNRVAEALSLHAFESSIDAGRLSESYFLDD
jgi:hypothetical protein